MQLSPREIEVVERLANGKCPGEIAFELGIAEGTVAGYVRRAKRKLRAENTSHIIGLAVAGGLVRVHGLGT